MEDQESLEASAVISQLANSIKDEVHNLFADGVMSSSVVISGVLFPTDHLFGMKELAIGASPHLIDDRGLQVEEHSAGHVLA